MTFTAAHHRGADQDVLAGLLRNEKVIIIHRQTSVHFNTKNVGFHTWLNKRGLLWVIWSLGSWLWGFEPLVEKQSISSGTSRCVKAAHYIQRCAAEASLHSVLPLPFPSFLLFNFPLLWTRADCCLDNRMPSFSPARKVNPPLLSAEKREK